MADDLKVSLGVELEEGSFQDVQSKLDKFKNSKDYKVRIQLDKSATNQINTFQKTLEKLSNKVYPIKFQIDQGSIGNIQNLINNLNQATTNAQNSIAQTVNGASANFGSLNNSRSFYSLTQKNGENIREQEKFNKTLGETKTIIRDLKSGDETTVLSTNFAQQNKAIDSTLNKLTDYYNTLNDLQNKAFGYDQNLSGTKYEAEVADQINTIKQALDEMYSSAQGREFILDPEHIRDISVQFNTLKNTISSSLDLAFPKTKNGQSDITTQIETQLNLLESYKNSLSNFNQMPDSVKDSFAGLKDMLESMKGGDTSKTMNDYISQFRLLKSEVDKFKSEQKSGFLEDSLGLKIEKITDRLQNLKDKYTEFIKNNPDSANSGIEQSFERIQQAIDNIDMKNIDPSQVKLLNQEVGNLGTKISGVVTPARSLGQALQQSFGGLGQYLARFTSSFYLINKGIQVVKSMVSEVISLDTSLMELQKVTDLSGESLTQFTDKSYELGKEVGRTGKDVVDAVTTFSRAGYDLNEATQLAQSALVMTNVGVDIPNTEAAASDMISILKAYDKQANESMEVVDKLYNVANKEPLDFGNITDMLVTAGGTLAQTGTSLEQSMGLLTGAFATLRDTSVANGLIMISQRLRGVKEDGEAIEEAGFMPKLKQAFGEVGVAIEDENGELRSTFDILNDLAGVWDQLTSKQQQFLGEKAAGNRQVKTLNAIMANWDVVQDTIQKANEATGEGTKGNEKYLDSIQGRITQFKSSFQDLSREVVNSDLVKWLVSIGTSGLDSLTKIFSSLNNIFEPIGKIFDAAGQTLSKLRGDFKSVSEPLQTTRGSIKEQETNVQNLNAKLEDTQALIADLESKESLTVVEQEELNRLKELNNELKTTINLENAKISVQRKTETREASNAMLAYQKGSPDYGFLDELDSDSINKAKERVSKDFISSISQGLRAIPGVNLQQNAAPYTGRTNFEQVKNAYATIDYLAQESFNRKRQIDEINMQLAEETNQFEIARLEGEKSRLQSEKDYLDYYYEADLKILSNYSDKLGEIIGDLPRVENPQTPAQENINRGIDVKGLLDEKLITSQIDGIDSLTDYIASKYSEQMNSIKESIEGGEEVSYEYLLSNFPEVVNAFEEYSARLGLTSDSIANHLNQIYSSTPNASSGSGYVSYLDVLISKDFTLTESYKTLTAAMTEQQKAGVITMETYKALMDDEGLPGIQKYLTLTAEGFALNTDGIYDYIKAQNAELKQKAVDELIEKQEALEDLKNKLAGLTDAQEIAATATLAEQTQDEVTALQAYINSLDAATGALARYRAAKKTPNDDTDYNEGQGALKDIKEGWKSGKVGTDDYQDAMGFFLGEGWQGKEGYQGENGLKKAQKDAEKVGNRYFKDEKNGVDNFIIDLEKLSKVSDKVNFTEDGKLEIADDTSLQEIAQGLSEVTGNAEMSEDAVESLFKLLQTYSFDKFQWPNNPDNEDRDAKRKELEDTKTELENKRDSLINEADSATQSGDIELAKKLNQQAEEAGKQLDTVNQQIQEFEGGEEASSFTIDTAPLDALQTKLQSIQDLVDYLNQSNISVPSEITGQASEIAQEICNRINELQNDGEANVTINGNGESAEGAILSVEEGLAEVGKGADAPLYATDKTAEGIKEAEQSVNGIDANPVEIQGDASGVEDAAGDANDAISDIDEPDDVEFDGNADGVEDASKDATEAVNTFGNLPPPEAIPLQAEDKASEASEGASSAVNTFGMLPPPDAKELKAENKTQEGIDEAKGNLYTYEADKYNSTIGAIPDNASITSVSDQLDDAARNRDSTITVTLKDSDGNEWTPEQYQNYRDKNYRPDPDEDPNGYGLPLIKKGSTPNSYSEPNPPLSQEMLEEFRIGYEASLENPDAISEEAQEAADSNPIEMPMELEPPEEPVEVEVEYETPAEPVPGPAPSPAPTPTPEATPTPSSITQSVNADTSAAESAINSLDRQAEDGATKPVDANVSSALNAVSQLDKAASKSVTKTIKVETTGEPYAKGTDYAAKGPSLVDEEGAELIEHTKRGTYELGTNNGARMTYLDKGDVVHTARETKTILSRMAKVGGFFRDGLNKGKSIIGGAFARGISGSISLSNIKRVLSSSRKSINGGTKGSNSSSASGTSNKKFKKWAEKLFDWAEIRLARLKTVTNGWLLSAAEAIGYMAQNAELTNALGAVEDEIEATTAAYDLYIKQADEVQKRAKLSDDIVEKIKQGNIEISSYKKEIQEKIKEYQKWYRFYHATMSSNVHTKLYLIAGTPLELY